MGIMCTTIPAMFPPSQQCLGLFGHDVGISKSGPFSDSSFPERFLSEKTIYECLLILPREEVNANHYLLEY